MSTTIEAHTDRMVYTNTHIVANTHYVAAAPRKLRTGEWGVSIQTCLLYTSPSPRDS